MVSNVQRPWRLPIQFRADGFGIFAPGLKISAKRMKQHHPLRLGRQGSLVCKANYQEKNNTGGRADTTHVNPIGYARPTEFIETQSGRGGYRNVSAVPMTGPVGGTKGLGGRCPEAITAYPLDD